MDQNGLPIVGQIPPARPIILQAPDGSQILVPQVFVAQLNPPIMHEIVARCAVAVTSELLGELLKALEARGIIPAQTKEEPADEPTAAVPAAASEPVVEDPKPD